MRGLLFVSSLILDVQLQVCFWFCFSIKTLYNVAPALSLWNSSSELSDKLYPGLQSSASYWINTILSFLGCALFFNPQLKLSVLTSHPSPLTSGERLKISCQKILAPCPPMANRNMETVRRKYKRVVIFLPDKRVETQQANAKNCILLPGVLRIL